ncbi:MAG: zinc-ribbon domain containing protein [Patescibacteria group bacterium]|jgi:DNA-directed RNA polymerase subunit RPC12/RpoP
MKCIVCQKEFTISNDDQGFYNKIAVPEPKRCPECRLLGRLAFRNERNLYRRKCDATGKEIISLYQPQSAYKIYDATY